MSNPSFRLSSNICALLWNFLKLYCYRTGKLPDFASLSPPNLLLCCYFAFERATHWAWRGESLCKLPVWNINAFLLGKLPTGWGTSCTAHTIPTSARQYPERGVGAWGGGSREWDLRVIHVCKWLCKNLNFSLIKGIEILITWWNVFIVVQGKVTDHI